MFHSLHHRQPDRGKIMMTTHRPQTFEPLPALLDEFGTLLRSLTPAEEAAAIPGLEWTVREVAAHVLTVMRRYLQPAARAATRSRLVALNDDEIAAVQASCAEIADDIAAITVVLGQVAPGIPADMRFPFHLGLTVSPAAGWANLIGELLVHGNDISRATQRAWSVDDNLLEGVWRDLLPAVAGWMRPEARAVDEVYHLSFPFGSVVLAIHSGEVRVDDPRDAARMPDHAIQVTDAAAFTLQFPYRRACIIDPAAALLASRFTDI
jgi:uncharacterized protein (TIGR03083 family)